MPRLPEQVFRSSLTRSARTSPLGRKTVGVSEARAALAALEESKAAPEERARIVEAFLTSAAAARLSPSARQALAAFAQRSSRADADHPDGGMRMVELRARRHREGGAGDVRRTLNDGTVPHVTLRYPSDQDVDESPPLRTDDKKTGEVKADTVREIRKALDRGTLGDLFTWTKGTVADERPLLRFVAVEVLRERGADGHVYRALIPVGSLTPRATRHDPNTVDTIYFERTGGLTGLTSWTGPVALR